MQNKVVKNAAWIIMCRIVQAVLSLIVTMLTARYLAPKGYGLINYAASLVAFVTPIMKLGLDSILVQAFVNKPDESGKLMGTTFVMSLASSVLCILGVIGFAIVANAGDRTTILVCALYSISLFFQALELVQYYFQAQLKSKYISIIGLIAYFLVSAYKIFLLIAKSSIYWFAISHALDYLIISFLLIRIFCKISGQKLRFSFATAKGLFANSKYYIISNLMVVIFATTDKIMINLMLGATQTGYYSAAVACASMTAFVFSAIIDSFRPVIFESKKANNNEFEGNVAKLYSIIIYLSLIQSVIIATFSPLIINILYGVDYATSVDALRIIVWYTTFAYLGSVRNIWILAEGHQKYLWIINLSGALVNVLLNLVFIPKWGINGAAFASLITQIFTNIIISFVIKLLRPNGVLMLKGLNPKTLFSMIRNSVKKD